METVLADAAKLKKNADEVMNVLVSLLGCGHADALALRQRARLAPAGARGEGRRGKEPVPVWERARHARTQKHQRARKPVKSDSPFALLADLIDVD